MEEAYKDAMELIKIDPKNKAIVPIAQRLTAHVMAKVREIQLLAQRMLDSSVCGHACKYSDVLTRLKFRTLAMLYRHSTLVC